MALLWRVQARWSGGQIGAGFTNLHFTAGISTAQLAMDAGRAFLSTALGAAGGILPVGVSITFPAGVEEFDVANGSLSAIIPVTAGATIAGGDTSVYAAPAGGIITWLTNGITNGHTVQGRTFLVPLGGFGMQTDGTLSTVALSQFNTAAAALIAAAPEFTIWTRPTTKVAADGKSSVAVGFRIPDRASILTSRR